MKVEFLNYFWPTKINFPGLKKLKVEFLIYFRLLKSSGRKYVFHCFLKERDWWRQVARGRGQGILLLAGPESTQLSRFKNLCKRHLRCSPAPCTCASNTKALIYHKCFLLAYAPKVMSGMFERPWAVC